MKILAALSLVIVFLTLVFLHFGKEIFNKDMGASLTKRTKKTVLISDLPGDLYSGETLIGNWVLFLHYPDKTATVDIFIDDHGKTSSRDKAVINDLKTSVNKQGSVKMENDLIRMEGGINPESNHISGMAIIHGVKAPVPFSAFKFELIENGSPQGNPVK